jgi:hypothetical protein
MEFAMTQAAQTVAIEVSCNLDDWDDLDIDDQTSEGEPKPDGTYLINVHDIPEDATRHQIGQAALAQFHSIVPISFLEDFMVLERDPTDPDLEILGSSNFLGDHPFLKDEFADIEP